MAIDNIQEELSLVPRHNKKGTGMINWTNDEKNRRFGKQEQRKSIHLQQLPYGKQREMNLLKNFEVGGLDRAILYGGVNFGSWVQHENLR